MSDHNPLLESLNPHKSAVVEACAGSGKTWLLASRIVCLLLAGAKPGEILAITFTRKAAREIEARVMDWLRQMSIMNDENLRDFLAERAQQADAKTLQKARRLYKNVLTAQPSLMVNTFHGWFLQLMQSAPLLADLAGFTLNESSGEFFNTRWDQFLNTPENPTKDALLRLFHEPAAHNTKIVLRKAYEKRIEWLAITQNSAKNSVGKATEKPAEKSAALIAQLASFLNVQLSDLPLEDFFTAETQKNIAAYLEILMGSELAGDQESVEALKEAQISIQNNRLEESLALLSSAFLTKSNEIPKAKQEVSKALIKRFKEPLASRLISLHRTLATQIIHTKEHALAVQILRVNADFFTVFAEFFAEVDAHKQITRQMDFNDAEWRVLCLLQNDEYASLLQARLDARFKHVLLDEFQDTSPAQWQILQSWLAAYSDNARPTVFLVGDPKQSIYRFRRAEPRLFQVASAFLQQEYAALFCTQDATRRNAQPIIDLVNSLFLDEAIFTPFRAQSSLAKGLSGRIELVPLFSEEEKEKITEVALKNSTEKIKEEAPEIALRNPLTEALIDEEDARLFNEAAHLAKALIKLTKTFTLSDKNADGTSFSRLANFGDVMLLVRSRTHLKTYQQALAAAGIPFISGTKGGLLDAPEIADILALLTFLSSPLDNLALAHALRSPVFACSNEDLIALALIPEAAVSSLWWEKLKYFNEAQINSPLPSGEGVGVRESRLARAYHLLTRWKEAANRLPVHDLLDVIYHEGDVLARYLIASPKAFSDAAQANLEALILFALDSDEGRFPSLPRFMDALKKTRQADAQDAPDEGEIYFAETAIDAPEEALQDAKGRVRILTIHGAKGLEAPIVWWANANANPSNKDFWDILVSWQPEDENPSHYSVYGGKETRGVARAPLFLAELAAARREELNLLYVAITRARQLFVMSGRQNKKTSKELSAYQRVEAALQHLGAVKNADNNLVFGDQNTEESVLVIAPTREIKEAEETDLSFMPSGKRVAKDAHFAEEKGAQQYGIFLHAALEKLVPTSFSKDFSPSKIRLNEQANEEESAENALKAAQYLFKNPALQRFFDPQQFTQAFNEITLIARNGNTLRLDRLVEFNNETQQECWILDYKSGSASGEFLVKYETQIKEYIAEIKMLYPKHKVRGLLIFTSGEMVEIA